MPKFNNKGFTLIELLIVIAIIGVLSTIVLSALGSSQDKAKVSKVVTEVRDLRRVIELYFLDTGQYPLNDCTVGPNMSITCISSSDPFSNSLSIPKWNGPYIILWNKKHPWGGHIGYG